MNKSTRGFTIVELLIVIVIIAILAAITIVAYNGIQNRANDSRRMNDLSAMQKVLAQHHLANGSFPLEVANPGSSSWEISSDPGFFDSLDTITNGTKFQAPGTNTLNNGYWYHRFNAGAYSCPASAGAFYVLWIRGMQTQNGGATVVTNSCPAQTLISGGTLANPSYYFYFGFSPS